MTSSFKLFADVEVLSTREATIATVSVENAAGDVATYSGTAKRAPGDKHVPDIGEALAIARAFGSASRAFQRLADGLQRQEEHNRPHSAKARAEREARKAKGQQVEVHRVQRRRSVSR